MIFYQWNPSNFMVESGNYIISGIQVGVLWWSSGVIFYQWNPGRCFVVEFRSLFHLRKSW